MQVHRCQRGCPKPRQGEIKTEFAFFPTGRGRGGLSKGPKQCKPKAPEARAWSRIEHIVIVQLDDMVQISEVKQEEPAGLVGSTFAVLRQG